LPLDKRDEGEEGFEGGGGAEMATAPLKSQLKQCKSAKQMIKSFK